MLVNLENLITIKDEKPPESLVPWLHCQTSLTSKLYSIKGEAKLRVLGQIWKQPTQWEKNVLGLVNDAVLQREILVFADNKPYHRSDKKKPYQPKRRP